jgi:hypothetical protein
MMGNIMDDLFVKMVCGICRLPISEPSRDVDLPEGVLKCHQICAEAFEWSRPSAEDRRRRLEDKKQISDLG